MISKSNTNQWLINQTNLRTLKYNANVHCRWKRCATTEAILDITMMMYVDFVKKCKQIEYKSKADRRDRSTNFEMGCELSWPLETMCNDRRVLALLWCWMLILWKMISKSNTNQRLIKSTISTNSKSDCELPWLSNFCLRTFACELSGLSASIQGLADSFWDPLFCNIDPGFCKNEPGVHHLATQSLQICPRWLQIRPRWVARFCPHGRPQGKIST